MNQYDDGTDLSDYNFSEDGFGPALDPLNKRKLAYRHRIVAEKYRKVNFLFIRVTNGELVIDDLLNNVLLLP